METYDEIDQEINDLIGDTEGKEMGLALLRKIKQNKVKRLKYWKYQFFIPNGKAEQYIKKIGEGNFITLFSAANGVGKTATSVNIIAHIIWGEDSQNSYFNYSIFKDWPYPKRGRIVSDPANIKTNLIPALKEWFPKGRYKTIKAGKQYDSIWKTDNGFEFDIMSYEQDVKEFESTTLGWAWFDEPPTQAIFKATVSRMRKGGIIFISETPLYAAWLYDHIIANPDKDLESKGQRAYVEAGVESACIQHGIRGHLEHDDIEKMIAEYSEDEKQARVYGKFQHLIGLRFKQFSRNIHVIKPFEINIKDFTVYEALDPHPRTNDTVNWLAVDRQGRKFIIDELWLKCTGGTSELAERIKNKASQYRIERRIIDPSALIEDQHTQQSLHSRLASLGLYYVEASKLRTLSDRRIEDALSYNKIDLGDGNEEFIKAPELYIFDTCKRTLWEFEHLRWDDWTGKAGENKNQKQTAVDKDDHTIENIGRLLIQEPKFMAIPVQNMDYPEEDDNPDPYD